LCGIRYLRALYITGQVNYEYDKDHLPSPFVVTRFEEYVLSWTSEQMFSFLPMEPQLTSFVNPTIQRITCARNRVSKTPHNLMGVNVGSKFAENVPSTSPFPARGEGFESPSLGGRGKGEGDNVLKSLGRYRCLNAYGLPAE